MKTRISFLIYGALLMAIILDWTAWAYSAEQFIPVTGDKKVSSRDQVKIKKVVTEQKIRETFYSLSKEQERLADLKAEKIKFNTEIDAKIAAQEALIASITTEVDKVKLFVIPEPSFTISVKDCTVTLTNTSTGDIDAYQWDFGDGNTIDTKDAVHTYKEYGEYKISLTITAPDNKTYLKMVEFANPNPKEPVKEGGVDGLPSS